MKFWSTILRYTYAFVNLHSNGVLWVEEAYGLPEQKAQDFSGIAVLYSHLVPGLFWSIPE
jgi:hypothetical protein